MVSHWFPYSFDLKIPTNPDLPPHNLCVGRLARFQGTLQNRWPWDHSTRQTVFQCASICLGKWWHHVIHGESLQIRPRCWACLTVPKVNTWYWNYLLLAGYESIWLVWLGQETKHSCLPMLHTSRPKLRIRTKKVFKFPHAELIAIENPLSNWCPIQIFKKPPLAPSIVSALWRYQDIPRCLRAIPR